MAIDSVTVDLGRGVVTLWRKGRPRWHKATLESLSRLMSALYKIGWVGIPHGFKWGVSCVAFYPANIALAVIRVIEKARLGNEDGGTDVQST